MFQYLQTLLNINQTKRTEKIIMVQSPVFEKPRAYKNTTSSEAIQIKN